MFTPKELVTLVDERVARAVHLFDTWGEHPQDGRAIERAYEIPVNWRDAIPGPLTGSDMYSDNDCVLARVMTRAGVDHDLAYMTGLDLLDMTAADAAQHGFDLSAADIISGGMQFGDLAMAWNRALGHDMEERYRAQAKYQGADAALVTASWVIMSEADARSFLNDVDDEVMDRYREPNLYGEFADDPTPNTLALEIVGHAELAAYEDDGGEIESALASAWEEGRDLVWADALQAVALRTLGDVIRALEVEQRNEHIVKVLREGA